MKKAVIVINGAGGVGKDTLCNMAKSEFRIDNISSITPIKRIAKMCGWNGKKDDKSRRFLSDLKLLCVEYNDYPTLWAKGDLDLFFLFWYEHKLLLDALQYSSLSGLLVERAANFSLEENHLPQQLKHFSLEFREIAGAFAVCGLMSMLLQWHRQGFLISPEQMTKLAVELLTRPLLRL